jgi:phosphinothricin acetyltransferase
MSSCIRLAGENDAEPVQAIYELEVLETAITFEVEPPTAADFRQRIRDTLADHPWLVCEREGEVCGYAYATTHRSRAAYRWSVDVSVYLHRNARGLGIGKALYAALLPLLPLQGYYNAYAGITLPNPASVGLHESVGFRRVGVYRGVGYKLGAWHDVGWWALDLQPRGADPPEPRPLPEILGRPEVAAALDRGSALLRRR